MESTANPAIFTPVLLSQVSDRPSPQVMYGNRYNVQPSQIIVKILRDPHIFLCKLSICSKTETTKCRFFSMHIEPPFPVIPNTFSTKLEAIIADGNMTVSAEEYFDFNNNRAALFMLQGDDISKLIFDYSTEELFYVYRMYKKGVVYKYFFPTIKHRWVCLFSYFFRVHLVIF